MRTPRQRFRTIGTVAALVVLTTTSCSSTGSPSQDATTEETPAAEPIVAAADPSLLPYNFLDEDGTTWQGINIDLAALLSAELGRDIVFESAGFDTIIPGLASGRYDVALTGMFDTKERQETVDFVDYLLAKNDFLTRSDYRDVESMDDLCGEVVGIPGGALEADLLAEASAACAEAGDPEITVNEFADLDATVLALQSGRIDVSPNDSAANAYIVSRTGETMKTSGVYLNEGYFAAGFSKDSELTAEFESAFAAIIDSGAYGELLEEWGITDRAMDAPIVNGSPF